MCSYRLSSRAAKADVQCFTLSLDDGPGFPKATNTEFPPLAAKAGSSAHGWRAEFTSVEEAL